MAIVIDGQTKRLGLALSGGGFRAAAFHLGVFRKLHQLGLLWQLDRLSCVSGGSIAGAYLAAHWGDDSVLDRLHEYPAADVEYVTLSGGGIYDNLGINPLLRAKPNDLDYAIVSDAGKPFEIDPEPTETGIGVIKESIGILMEQVRGLQFNRLELSWRSEAGPRPLWFSIDSAMGEAAPGDAVFASNIRTHLKKLKDEELAVLDRHAQALLTHRIDTYAPELKTAG